MLQEDESNRFTQFRYYKIIGHYIIGNLLINYQEIKLKILINTDLNYFLTY